MSKIIYRIKTLKQTCLACPSQWEGTLEDNRMIYIRYRWGYLSVRISPEPTTDVYKAVDGKKIFEKIVDEKGWDGIMDLSELIGHTSGILEFPNIQNKEVSDGIR